MSKPLHILHVIDSLAAGGAERMAIEIANHTDRHRQRVSLCVTRSDLTLASTLVPQVQLLVLGRTRRRDWAGFKTLLRFLQEQDVSLLHVHGRSSLAFVVTTMLIGAMRRPIVFHDHYGRIYLDDRVPLWFRVIGRFWATHYVGVSRRLGNWARSAGLVKERITVVPNALDLAVLQDVEPVDMHTLLGVDRSRLIGIVVANIRPEKGILTLLDAVSKCRSLDRFVVVILGCIGDMTLWEQCENFVQRTELKDYVRFLGTRTDVSACLHGADFGLLSSLSESGPLALIEYMAAGLPLVATSVGEIAFRVAELGGEEFVPPGDSQALAEAIDRLVTAPPDKRKARGQKARKLVLHFDISRVMERWYKVYEQALQDGLR